MIVNNILFATSIPKSFCYFLFSTTKFPSIISTPKIPKSKIPKILLLKSLKSYNFHL